MQKLANGIKSLAGHNVPFPSFKLKQTEQQTQKDTALCWLRSSTFPQSPAVLHWSINQGALCKTTAFFFFFVWGGLSAVTALHMADEVQYQDESPRVSSSSAELRGAVVWAAAAASCNYQSQSWQAYNNTNPQRRATNKACIQIRSLISKVHAHTHTHTHTYTHTQRYIYTDKWPMMKRYKVTADTFLICDMHACTYVRSLQPTHTHRQIWHQTWVTLRGINPCRECRLCCIMFLYVWVLKTTNHSKLIL